MRVGILTQYYHPEMGAPQARLANLARRFVKRGHQVFVLTAMPNYPRGHVYPGYGGFFRREVRDGVVIIRALIYPTKSARMGCRLANYFSFVLSSLIGGGLALPEMDYLITESPPLFLGMTGYLLSRLKGARWIFNVSDLWPDSAVRLGIVVEGWKLRISQALEAFCYRKAWLVTGQSNEIINDIQSRFPDVPVYHFSNGVDTNLFGLDNRSTDLRYKLTNGKACVAVYAGLHGLAQGLEQILEAAVKLQCLNEFCIAFIGDGPEKDRLVNQAQSLGLNNVRFLDPYPHDVMPVVLASADIALVPLKFHLPGALPSKLFEAMGAGLPVVLVADGEAGDIVRQTHAGFVVPPGDIQALALAIRELVENPDRRHQLGLCSRRAVVDHFDRQVIADAFINHLEYKSLDRLD